MPRLSPSTLPTLGVGAIALLIVALELVRSNAAANGTTAPELPTVPAADWLNSKPLTVMALRGHPVLIEFWTFDCVNCRNSLPWLRQVQARYAPHGLTVIAVHSPELAHERDPIAVAAHVRQLGISWPVLIDDDFRYWNALGNQFWPAFYLIDPQGRIIATRIGELHTGERGADDFERAIAGLVRSHDERAAHQQQ